MADTIGNADVRPEPPKDVTQLLAAISAGDRTANDQLLARVYEDLRRLAERQFRGERAGHTLQPTALVHEAYECLLGGTNQRWDSRAHFFGAAARAMRQVMIDYARARGALKRPNPAARQSLEPDALLRSDDPADLLDLDDALKRLAEVDERAARVIELRFFAGLNQKELAEAIGCAVPTVGRSYAFGMAWLRRALAAADNERRSSGNG